MSLASGALATYSNGWRKTMLYVLMKRSVFVSDQEMYGVLMVSLLACVCVHVCFYNSLYNRGALIQLSITLMIKIETDSHKPFLQRQASWYAVF